MTDTYYHIHNRGNNREDIFVEERNYGYFLSLFAIHCLPVVDLYAYALLKNHFHMLVRVKSEEEIIDSGNETPRVSKTLGVSYPSKKFSDFFNAYAKAINKAYGRTGSLFQHPFGRVAVTGDRQFWNVIAYIHQNPQKHRFVKDFREWKYSSYGVVLASGPVIVRREAVLKRFGGVEEYRNRHARWVDEARSRWFVEEDVD